MQQIINFFLLFTAYSFIGWVCESVYCSIPAKKFINRGFLNGPFCPIYGAGAILVIAVLSPLRQNPAVLFLAATLLTSLLEYTTGFAMEMLFHTKYWDYSDHRFNLQGRVCLENTLIFGLLSVILVRYLHPFLVYLLSMIPTEIVPLLAGLFLLYFTLDITVTVSAICGLNGRLAELQKVLDEIKEKAYTATAETREAIASRLDEATLTRLKVLYETKGKLECGFRLMQRRIIRAFPTMKSLRSNESLQRVREVIQNRKKFIHKG